MKIAVIALGKIGLPLAVQFASKGHDVIGVDVNPKVVDLVNAATEPFPGEAHLQEKLSELVPAGRLRATTDYADAVPGAEAVVLVVPLFVDDELRGLRARYVDLGDSASLAERLLLGIASTAAEPREVWIEEHLRPARRRRIERAWPGKPVLAGDVLRSKLVVKPGAIERIGYTIAYDY